MAFVSSLFRRCVGCAALVATGCAVSPGPRDAIYGPPALPTVNAPNRVEPRPISEREAIDTALRHAQQNDLAAAVRTIAQVGDTLTRGRVIASVADSLAERDPARAAAFSTELPPGLAQAAAIDRAGRAWALRDREAALPWAVNLADPVVAGTARRAVATGLVQSNARDAIDRIEALPAGAARDDLLVAAASAWARQDQAAALEWLRRQPDNPLKARLTTAIGFELAQKNPNGAIALAETLPPGRNRWLLFSAIAQTWVAVDEKAALAWAQALPSGEPRDAAFAGVDTGLGIPRARRVASAPRGTSPRIRGGMDAVARWPEMSSPAFAAWLAQQPPGLSREEAILEYVRQRGLAESMAIGQWLTTLPGGPTRQRAMEIYLEGLLVASPQDAANWLQSLPRSERSDAMVEKTVERWLLTNPDAAEAWLRDSTLAPILKEELLRRAGR